MTFWIFLAIIVVVAIIVAIVAFNATKTNAAKVPTWIGVVAFLSVAALGISGYNTYAGMRLTTWIDPGLKRTDDDNGLMKWELHDYQCHPPHIDPNANCGSSDHIPPPPPPPKW